MGTSIFPPHPPSLSQFADLGLSDHRDSRGGDRRGKPRGEYRTPPALSPSLSSLSLSLPPSHSLTLSPHLPVNVIDLCAPWPVGHQPVHSKIDPLPPHLSHTCLLYDCGMPFTSIFKCICVCLWERGCWLVAVAAVIGTVLWSSYMYVHVLMRDEKEERSKQSQTNNKAKQHSTPSMHVFIIQETHVQQVPTCTCTCSSAVPVYMEWLVSTCTCRMW